MTDSRETASLDETWFSRTHDRLSAAAISMSAASPYPHLVLDDFLPVEFATACAAAFPTPNTHDWIHYSHFNSAKWGLTDISKIPTPLDDLIHALNSAPFLESLSVASGIDDLLADPDLSGGGLHMTGRGGFLNVHTDFTSHPTNRNWQRRLNLLLYLNADWQESWGGKLELWNSDVSACAARITPEFNRCVIFATDERSYHGVPEKLETPPDQFRSSVALYYFTAQDHTVDLRSTNYRPRPVDGRRGWIIRADNWALGRYAAIRSKFGISDQFMGRLLGPLQRKNRRPSE